MVLAGVVQTIAEAYLLSEESPNTIGQGAP